MRAHRLRVSNFRNHVDTTVEGFSEHVNVIVGPNGAGKTSLLEALSLATLTKSFSTASDAVLIRSGATTLLVEASMRSDLGVPHNVTVTVEPGPPLKKTLVANNDRVRSSAELVGRAPVVVLTPDDKIITSGPPGERRRFLSLVLSQANRTYLEDELEYKRTLKQRNAILADAKTQRRSLSYLRPFLEPWTDMLVKLGTRIMQKRASFCEEFRPYLLEAYQLLSESKEDPSLQYLPMGLEHNGVEFGELLRSELARNELDELRRGTSLAGPHRDDLILNVNPGQSTKYYASQGQHKTYLVSMKLAEFRYLREATGETPLLLLDDVFSELDKRRAHQLLELASTGDLGQTFITSTDREVFEAAIDFATGYHSLYLVDSGTVRSAY